MPDPNAIYKTTFAELTQLLGRTPVSTDAGWVEMHEEYKKAWGPSEETIRAPRAMAGTTAPQTRADNGFSREPAPQAGSFTREEDDQVSQAASLPLGGPGISQNGAKAGTAGTRVGASPRLYQGGRGPNGGVLAVCEACGQEWEREKRRGRPALLCGECR